MSKRARILDNNPLSPTDSVLDSFAQYGKPESQPVNKSASQEVERLESAESDFPDLSDTIEPDSVEPTPPAVKSTRRKAGKSTGQQANKSGSQPASKLASQEVDKPTLKKATFQLSESVLQQLDTFHLQLQLKLGKANAPYKEVMVEEAILMLLERANQNRAKLLNSLQSRQQQRE